MKTFPWQTLILLGLITYLLVVLLSLWWRTGGSPWTAIIDFAAYFSWEPWMDAVLLHGGALFILYRWWQLIKALWRRYGP